MDSFHASERSARLVVKAGSRAAARFTSNPYAMHAGALLKSQNAKSHFAGRQNGFWHFET